MMRRHARAAITLAVLLGPAQVVLFAPLQAARAEELGRLFFTPQQRQDMDRRRASNVQAVAASSTTVDLITINGRVTRGNGETTTWINGAPQNDVHGGGNRTDRIIIRAEDMPTASVRVGETLDRTKGEKRDLLGDGSISVHVR